MKEWTGKGFTIKATKKDKKSINIDDLQKLKRRHLVLLDVIYCYLNDWLFILAITQHQF